MDREMVTVVADALLAPVKTASGEVDQSPSFRATAITTFGNC